MNGKMHHVIRCDADPGGLPNNPIIFSGYSHGVSFVIRE